jgi:Ca2+-binding RTX toxin-like protein
VAGVGAALLAVGVVSAPTALAAPVGQGFNLNASDLRFIFKQIQIAQNHSATATTASRCQTQVGSGPNQIPATQQGRELPWGLRTVDGSCNNLVNLAGRETWGAADTVFPRVVPAAPRGGYANPGSVTDGGPRQASNLIVDQSPSNPAAVAVAGTDQPAPGDGDTLFIENVATDVGLSAPFNSWFTLFGQFFDHGLDLVTKGGNGTVVMPLAADDPLVTGGRDGDPATTADNVPAGTPMLLTRATDVADPGNQARNTTTSFVDQNQTYTSHPAHQVFLREFELVGGVPVETGRMLEGPGGGLASWDDVQAQAEDVLGIVLSDQDVLNVPLLMTDAYGHFERGPSGLPQIVNAAAPGGLQEGNLTTPVSTAGATRTGHAFLDDIAHHAVPVNQAGAPLTADGDTNGTTDDGNPATYDDEMLGAHFLAGDGRANENIGLTTVHHVFHSEHNRLRDNIDQLIHDPATGLTAAEIAGWENVDTASGWGYGERLFQAARFVTEMEYQHLVFEEFGRKVQPLINLFGEGGTGYNTTVNASIRAEFAHAVYRFGHSMLTETVARRTASGGNRDIPLLDAFLNPPSFLEGGLTADQAAGEIVRGMTRQPGNEIDEFVTGALRNNLLGLPLDLASINMARARDTGIPTLNEARRAFFAASANTQVRPYESWADFAFSLKHRESLPNFIAAFGTHPSITGDLAQRRNAAELIVYGPEGADGILGDDPLTTDVDESADDPTGTQPADAFDFLNSLGASAQSNGRTVTGVDDIDLWVGGLAEKQMVFGGLLGPTFNYVFEQQMEDLQDGDRFYYLSRTAGLNLLTQLEGNSFAELIMRNTDASGLAADSFSFPAMVFDVDAIDGNPTTVVDDPATPDWNEATELTRMLPSGTIRYGGPEHVVFNGSDVDDPLTALVDESADRLWSSEGDDTLRGNGGNDTLEGGDGVDNLIGGLGDDLLTDLNGDDTLKGGDGDDTLSSGQGFGGDLNQGGLGNDLIIGGNDITETFAGSGNDFVFAGDAEDTVFGDDGDDWIETGRGPFALAQGDNGAPFQDDPNEPGHDVLNGDGGEQDYDAEGGDDIMLAGPGIQRSEGMRGFDWVTHQGDPEAADSDMDFTAAVPPAVETNRDRFDLVEALSGYELDDILRGDDRAVADLTAGANEPADSHVLDQAGIDRIAGLDTVLPAGTTRFDTGNIIIGGGGADLIEGRGGDDVIDGDAQLTVELRVPYKDGTTVRTVESLNEIRADALAGLIDPGDITIIRRIERPAAGGAIDTAVFSGPEADYDVTVNGDGTTTVAHTGGNGQDGTDTLRNIEVLEFADSGAATAPTAPLNVTGVAGNGQVTVNFTAPASDGGSPITEFEIDVLSGGALVRTVPDIAPNLTSVVVTGLTNGTAYTFVVRAINAIGDTDSAASAAVTPRGVPAAPAIGTATPGNASATVRWTAPTNNGGSAVTSYQVEVRTGTTVVRTVTGIAANATQTVVGTLTNGTPYNFRVRAVNAVGAGAFSAASNVVTPAAAATVPAAPGNVQATAGNASATVTWTAPANGGSAITGYQIQVRTGTTNVGALIAVPANQTSRLITGLNNNGVVYNFQVRAINAVGQGPFATSNAVDPAPTVAAAPTIGTATPGNASAIVRWTAPTNNGGSAITSYSVQVRTGNTVVRTVTGIPAASVSTTVTALTNGTAYNFRVIANNAVGASAPSAQSNVVTPAAPTVPGAPTNLVATSGVAGGAINASFTWVAPASNGGSPITSYRAFAQRLDANGQVVGATLQSGLLAPTARVMTFNLTTGGNYRFFIRANNAVGVGAMSAPSNTVIAR